MSKNTNNRMAYIAVFISLFLIGAGTVIVLLINHYISAQNPLAKDYVWINKEMKVRYSGTKDWKPISSNYYSKSKLARLSEKTKNIIDYNEIETDCLRYEGGIAQVCYWLETEDKYEIHTEEALAKEIGTITSPEDAAAIIAVTQTDTNMEGYTSEVDNGYLVEVFDKNTFGCRMHEPTKALYLVSYDATIQRLAFQKEKEPSAGTPVLCVD